MTRKRAGDVVAAVAVVGGIALALFVYYSQKAEEEDTEAAEERGRQLAAKYNPAPEPVGPPRYFTEKGTMACPKEADLDRARALMNSGNTDPEAAGAFLAARGCVAIPGGVELTVTDSGVLTMEVFYGGSVYFVGTSTIRTTR